MVVPRNDIPLVLEGRRAGRVSCRATLLDYLRAVFERSDSDTHVGRGRVTDTDGLWDIHRLRFGKGGMRGTGKIHEQPEESCDRVCEHVAMY